MLKDKNGNEIKLKEHKSKVHTHQDKIIERLETVKEQLLEGMQGKDLLYFCVETFGIGKRASHYLIAAAKRQLLIESQYDIKTESLANRMMHLHRIAMQSKNYNLAFKTLDSLLRVAGEKDEGSLNNAIKTLKKITIKFDDSNTLAENQNGLITNIDNINNQHNLQYPDFAEEAQIIDDYNKELEDLNNDDFDLNDIENNPDFDDENDD